MSANDFESTMLRFENSRDFARMRDDLLSEFMRSDGPAAVTASVEKLIASDLEANPRLLDALVASSESVSEGRLTTIFERRVRSEVEAGLTGRPFEEFLLPREEELAREVTAAVRRNQTRSD